MKLTLHVTDLDGWVWYNKLDTMTAPDLVARLKRTEPPNQKMLMGTAFHSAIENPCVVESETTEASREVVYLPEQPIEIDQFSHGGFTFKIECEACITLPQVCEIRASKTYIIDGIDVTLTGGCDGISGNKVSDHKLTFNPKPENYFDSYQWRAYLDIYNADVFEYIIYSAKEKGGVVSIHDISIMKMYRYPAMVDDLESGIRELVGFIKDHCPEMVDGFKDDILRTR